MSLPNPTPENQPPVNAPAAPPAAPQATPPATPPNHEDELLKARKDASDARKRADELQRQLDEGTRNGMRTSEQWKQLAETETERANRLEESNRTLQKALVDDRKYSALRAEAVNQGINPISLDDLDLLDFPNVLTETVNGRVNVIGVQAAIAKLKADRPNWFNQAPPHINPHTPSGGDGPPNGTVTVSDLLAAQAKYNASKSEADLQAYNALTIKFKQQGG